ncbi:MAG: hypothetical protein PHF86_11050 [Candidatus Nanoarchaeia archaeon]|nr:hypothetical protein [Candidatus Nanoarchaeia archaeon]
MPPLISQKKWKKVGTIIFTFFVIGLICWAFFKEEILNILKNLVLSIILFIVMVGIAGIIYLIWDHYSNEGGEY